ncbi:MAG: FG-GAP repeat domain-containing protein, partial [Saprospiraceae bacterium]
MQHFLLLLFLGYSISLSAQLQRAHLNPDFTTSVETLPANQTVEFRENNFEQIEGFPQTQVANMTFKNVRNCTLADLNGDGLDDILFVADDKLFAYAADGLLWQKNLGGVATYPPSVADIDKDGELEIVQAVFGGFVNGNLQVLEVDGTDATGFPLAFDNLLVTAPTLVDVDDDGLMEIIVNEIDGSQGNVHLLNADGTSFSENWPVPLTARPAVTPSVADVDNDGEKEIVVFSTEGRYILQLDGTPEAGFPQITDPVIRYSFHSPALVSLDNDDTFQVIG